MILEILLIVLFIMISGAVSGSETAFFSYNEHDASKRSKFYDLISKPYKLLLLILIINVVVNIGFTSIFEKFITKTLMLSGVISFLSITIFLLLFGEIIPKAIAINRPTFFIKVMTPVFTLLRTPTKILMNIFSFLENFFENIKGIIEPHKIDKSSLNNLLSHLLEGSEVTLQDSILLSNIFNWDTISSVSEMNDFTNIPSVIDETSLQLLSTAQVPFLLSRDKKGEVNSFLFYENGSFVKLNELYTVASQKSLYSTITKMLENNISTVIVIDEYGVYQGYIEKGKLINNIFEAFYENDSQNELKAFLATAQMPIADINRQYGLELSAGNYSTLNGFILENLGKIPKKMESFNIDGVKFTILKTQSNILEEVKIEPGDV